MRKILSVLLSTILLACTLLCGCTPTAVPADQYDVVATVFPAFDFVRAVAGDTLKIKMLISPGSEAHGFTPTLDDLALVQSCDLFIYTGGETDNWAIEQFASGNLDSDKFKSIAMTDCVQLLPTPDAIETENHDGHDHEHDEDVTSWDEHVWTSPENAVILVETFCDALCELYPDKADTFTENADAYIAAIKAEEADMQTVIDNAKNKTLVFENRFPFTYLCTQFGLSHIAAFDGCGGNTEVSASTLDTIVQAIRTNEIPCVLYLEFSRTETADQIVAATGCTKRELHSYHNVTREDFENGVTYVDLMKRNTETLKEALS